MHSRIRSGTAKEPIFNANVAAKFLLSRAVRDAGIKVVFTGEGSDEMLAGYMFERRDLMLYSRQYATDADRQAALAALIAANPLSAPLMFPRGAPAAGTRIIRDGIGFCPSWIESFAVQYRVMSELMRPDAPASIRQICRIMPFFRSWTSPAASAGAIR